MTRTELPYENTARSGASFSPDRIHRWSLWRCWEGCFLGDMIAFIGLNPSTADESANDPTVTRCINFAKRWNYPGMFMLNIFAFRATDPKAMKAADDPVGESNDLALRFFSGNVHRVVCCWGTHGAFRDRGPHVKRMLQGMPTAELCHLGLTKHGHPKHPLYLPGDTKPERW